MPTLVSIFEVEPLRIGGTETFARELSCQLAERGWKNVLCFQSEPTEEVRRFLDLPNVSIKVYAGPSESTFKAGKGIARIIRDYRPEILHLHYFSFINPYSWIARLQSVKQVFFTDHHSRPSGYIATRAPLWKRAIGRVVNEPLTKVICVSNYGHLCMSSFGLLPRDRFQMIYNGVDLSRVKSDPQRAIDFRRRYSIPLDRSIVTQVSWVIPEKGIIDFLETARLVSRQNRNVQFVIVGEGAYRQEYMRRAVEMGIEDHVTWTGNVEDPFGEGVFEAADVVCQFSRWEEVFGWTIAEAMAHGKPVVTTRAGGIPELVQDQESGYLVDRGDTKTMSNKVLTLLNDALLREHMGSKGKNIVRQKFDLRKNVTKLIASYGLQECPSVAEGIPVGRLQEGLS
ncbi:MAG TPA: glycosyltransferase family 4 protein [Pyrinomonadaceae bacterium]|nr:glycosyltransferase family 4 protein [Pyrinomonadaceae bacterium]